MAFGDRLKKLRDLIAQLSGSGILDLLNGVDISKIGPLVQAIVEFTRLTSDPKTEDGIVERVEKGLGIAKLFTEITAGTGDDELLATVNALLGDGSLLHAIARIVSGLISDDPHVPQAVNTQTFGAINWSTILELAKLIADLIKNWKA